MSTVAHLVVGPEEHGVVRHATTVARACGHQLLRAGDPTSVSLGGLRPDVVHVPFTDRLFGNTCEEAAVAFDRVADAVARAGAALSVTLHDVPGDGDDARAGRRRRAYATVAARCRGAVVSSWSELAAAGVLLDGVPVTAVIALPVVRADGEPSPRGRDVVVLGFVHPDRGYEHTLGSLPPGSALVAVGRAATGHEDLPDELARRAAACGRGWRLTGHVPDEALAPLLHRAAVPVAPHRWVSASASIATWLGHGRRPLVAASPYVEELERRWPGVVTVYDPQREGELAALIAAALADPASTRLDPARDRGPGLADVAAAYGAHLSRCADPHPIVVAPGRWTVPGNRWDLLDGWAPAEPPTVSVIVPHFESPVALDRLLRALAQQTHPADRLQVVVADDGSRRLPAVPFPVELVGQPDQGFRAAAARNLGAARADGDVLLFLDQDMVPTPDYVTELARLPALLPDALVVGRRRHTDLTGWGTDRVLTWLRGDDDPVGPPELDDPAWLRDAYRGSRDLLDADHRSYRFVISAVLGLSRALFDEVGGFEADIVGYGGEDWELAHRAWCAGAVLAHVPSALAWHDGGDWAARGPDPATKEAETLMLARLLPDPQARGGGQWLPHPATVATMVAGEELAPLLGVLRQVFATSVDCGFWLTGAHARRMAGLVGDPRVHAGEVPDRVRARALVVISLDGPADLGGLGEVIASTLASGHTCFPAGWAATSGALARERRHQGAGPLFPSRALRRPELPRPGWAPEIL